MCKDFSDAQAATLQHPDTGRLSIFKETSNVTKSICKWITNHSNVANIGGKGRFCTGGNGKLKNNHEGQLQIIYQNVQCVEPIIPPATV